LNLMGAVGRDGEDFLFHPNQEDRFPVCMPDQHLAIGQALSGNALAKIRFSQFDLILTQASSAGEE
jgi:hypothetical protein